MSTIVATIRMSPLRAASHGPRLIRGRGEIGARKSGSGIRVRRSGTYAQMLKRYADPELFAGAGREISFYYPEESANWLAQLRQMTSGLEAHEGAPGEVLEFNDVYVIPGGATSCLFDREGRRIAESCVRRGANLSEFVGADFEEVELPKEYTLLTEPLLYQSMYFYHWGHFLTESISRLWARYAHPELRALKGFFAGFSTGNARNVNTSQFLTSFSLAPLHLGNTRGPVRIEKCFVPLASFTNRASAFKSHLNAVHDVASTCLERSPAQRTAQPVYLSRSKLTRANRDISNEAELEDVLIKIGVKIVHPEELSLHEQIVLFNIHKTIIGCAGSAFHNILFSLNPNELSTHILSETALNKNCLIMDAIVGNQSHHACVIKSVQENAARAETKTLEIDLVEAIKYFEMIGLL